MSGIRGSEPPPAAAWLSSAFHDAEIVVIEDAVASAWKGRALRGKVTVDTRMDLWRLLAHANVCVDLAPGAHIARECVEALRFGTPIVVPADSGPAAVHARAGGATFSDETACSRRLPSSSASASGRPLRRAQAYADARYGDPTALVGRLEALLRQPGSRSVIH